MLENWIKEYWEIIMGAVLSSTGIIAWIFRWFENRAEKEETVAHQAMELIDRLEKRISSLESRLTAKTEQIAVMEEKIVLMQTENIALKRGINVLIGQLEQSGITPMWNPDKRLEAKEKRPPKKRPGGFAID